MGSHLGLVGMLQTPERDVGLGDPEGIVGEQPEQQRRDGDHAQRADETGEGRGARAGRLDRGPSRLGHPNAARWCPARDGTRGRSRQVAGHQVLDGTCGGTLHGELDDPLAGAAKS